MAQMEAIADRKAQLMLEENSKLGMLNPTIKRELFLELVKTAQEVQPNQPEQIKQIRQETQDTGTSRTEDTPEPSTWDTVQNTLGDITTGARGMATRLLRPAVRGVQQGVNYALDNSELLRSYVPADQQAELSAALYHSTGNEDYLKDFKRRMGGSYDNLDNEVKERTEKFVPFKKGQLPNLKSFRDTALGRIQKDKVLSEEDLQETYGPAFERYYGTRESGLSPLREDSYTKIYDDLVDTGRRGYDTVASTLDTGYRRALDYLGPEQTVSVSPSRVSRLNSASIINPNPTSDPLYHFARQVLINPSS